MGTAFNGPTSQAFTTWSPRFHSADQTGQRVDGVLPRAKKASLPAISARAKATDGKVAQRDQLILDYLHVVKAIAYSVRQKLPVHVDLDDLTHAGVLGLIDAATKYDPDKQVAFASYAKHRVKGAILDSLRQMDSASREIRKRHRQIDAATRDLAAELHRSPSELEIAERLGTDIERLRHTMTELHNLGIVSANTRATEHDDVTEPQYPGNPEARPDHMCIHEQRASVLHRAMDLLPERYKQVLMFYYTNDLTMKEIGERLNVNESRVSQIHKAAIEKMNATLRTAGITCASAF
jgi:RNA polymerase sigma factor FliA